MPDSSGGAHPFAPLHIVRPAAYLACFAKGAYSAFNIATGPGRSSFQDSTFSPSDA